MIGTPLWVKVRAAVEAARSGVTVTWIQARGTDLPTWAVTALLDAGVRWVCLLPRLAGATASLVVVDEVWP